MTSPAEKSLANIVEKYKSLAGNSFGMQVPLAAFGFTPEETEHAFGSFDEDYHISRYFHFTQDPGDAAAPVRTYRINGFPQTHLSLDAEIVEIL